MSKGGIGKVVGGIAGNVIGMVYGNRAAKADAANQQNVYNTYKSGLTAEQERLDPYAQQGGAAMSALSGLLTGQQYDPATGELKTLTPEQRSALFQTSPGYQFRMDEGLKAVQGSQAARNGLLNSGALKEIIQYSQGLAGDNEYNNYINQLAGLAGMGQNAATTQSNYGVGGLGDMANWQYGAGAGRTNTLMNRAGMYQSTLPMMGGMFGSSNTSNLTANTSGLGFNTQLSNPMAMGNIMSMFGSAASDINLKENIVKIGEENGFNIYQFNYKGNPDKYQGVIAQEVQEIKPEAVFGKDGFLAVDYSKIGIEFKKL